MKIYKADYITDKGIHIPTEMRLERITPKQLDKYLNKNQEERNGWCLQNNVPCAKYGARPCCPPNVPMFGKLKKRKYIYLFATVIEKEPYFELFPKQSAVKGKTRDYFFMRTSHYITRGMVGKMSNFLKQDGEQTFKVGGCNGCTYSKDGKCKDFRPALEATGINVVELSEEILDLPIQWMSSESLDHMAAVSALYTDREVKPKEIYEAYLKACDKRRK